MTRVRLQDTIRHVKQFHGVLLSICLLVYIVGCASPPTTPTPAEATPIPTVTPTPTATSIPAASKMKQPGAYPKLANYYAGGSTTISREKASLLAKWDLIVINPKTIILSPDSIRWIRQQNPNIKILAWVSAGIKGSFPVGDESWYLHSADSPTNPKPPEQRQLTLAGPYSYLVMNPASDFSVELPLFVNETIMSSGLFDGVFYDVLLERMEQPDIDINNDGVADSRAVIQQEYQNGMTRLLSSTRQLLGPEAIIIGNPGHEFRWSENSPYWKYANGSMQEYALGSQFGPRTPSWPELMEIYQSNMQEPPPPTRMHWIACGTEHENFSEIKPNLPPTYLQKMRFGLTTTLLGDGYFSFDSFGHSQLWWFPEYDADLGLPEGDAQQRSDGTWMREFENGTVMVNPSTKESIIEFPVSHKDVTTGMQSSRFVVPPKDGRILIRQGS